MDDDTTNGLNKGKRLFFITIESNKDNSIDSLSEIFSELDETMYRLSKYGFFVSNLEINRESFSFPYKMKSVDIKISNIK